MGFSGLLTVAVGVLKMLSLDYLNTQKRIWGNITSFICVCFWLNFTFTSKSLLALNLSLLFKVDLDKYMVTIQRSVNLKALKTVSLYSSLRCSLIVGLY